MADLIISQPMTFTVDVRNGLVERPQRESLMRGDRMANRIIAELVDGSEPFDITGVTVKGKFCRPPSGDEIDLTGEAKGNVATVQLTDQCYTSGGHYEARVILVMGGVERTVLFISGDVLKSGSGNAAGDEETGGSGGSTGSGLPAGGTAGQVLVKVSSAQGDAIWKNLTAADVGARPANWMPTAADVGALGKNETAANANQLNGKSADQYMLKTDTAADSAKLGGKEPKYYIQPRNRMDNSWWANPKEIVNQRGQTSYTEEGYTIDRWVLGSGTVTLVDDGLQLNEAVLRQYVPLKAGTYTAVFTRNDEQVLFCAFTFDGQSTIENVSSNQNSAGYVTAYVYSTGVIAVQLVTTNISPVFIWAALYEGEYTADNLPPYVPKGYVAELAECQRYYVRYDAASNMQFAPGGSNGGSVFSPFHLPARMRSAMSLDYSNVNLYNYKHGEAIAINRLSIEGRASSLNAVVLQAEYTPTSNLEAQQFGCVRILSGGYIAFSADL